MVGGCAPVKPIKKTQDDIIMLVVAVVAVYICLNICSEELLFRKCDATSNLDVWFCSIFRSLVTLGV